ncbi:MAG: sigma-70 family RNA polymerase sigma factor [Bacteroidota bacterium]
MSELELLKNGDKALIQKLYQECFRGIAGWVKRNSGREADAEDVFHDAMVTVYQKAVDNKLDLHCKLSTFVFAVSKKIWQHKLRTKGRYMNADFGGSAELSSGEEAHALQLAVDSEIESLYRRSFQKLSKECQEILNYFFNGLSIDAIAKRMNLASANLTRKRKFRCKNKLVELVESDPQFAELKQN